MKNIYKITLLVIFFAILSGCGSDNSVTNPPVNNEVVVSSNAKLIPPLDFQNSIVSFSSDSSLITLRQGAASINSLANGNILVTENGSGMIRKINSVQTQSGNVVLNTSQAALTDVFQKLNLAFDKQLSASDTTSIVPGDSVTITRIKKDGANLIDITLSFQNIQNGFAVSGEITFSISYHVDIRINNNTLQSGTEVSFTPSASVRLNAGLGVVSNFVRKVKLFDVNFAPFVVFIGGWPVVFTPNNSIYLKFDAEGRVTATAEVTSSIQATAGVTYNNNNWTSFVNESHNFSFVPPLPNLSIEADAKASLENEVSLRIYGIVGPYINVGPYLNLGVTATPPIKAELYGGIEGSIGVRVIILGYQLANFENLFAIAIRQKLWELALSGKISGSVRQAGNFVPISGCQITARRNGQVVETGTSLSDGTYEVSLPAANDYEVIYSKSGYISANYYNVNVQTFNTTYIETILQVQNSTMPGSISGTLTNATTGQGVPGISLKLRSGYNNTSGAVVNSTTTLSSGSYTFSNVQPGNYTVEASGTGYNTTYFSVYCVGGTNSSNQNATITPNGQNFQWRIVLTWGATPSDLDAHFTGPLSSGGRFHIYYANRTVSGVGFLDVDDVTSYGPETITLLNQIAGVYRYSVHDYTNRNLTSSFALSNSGAIVKVYKGNTLRATFPVPAGQGGTLWKVFEITDDIITPFNTFSYVSNPASITSMEDGMIVPFKKHQDDKGY